MLISNMFSTLLNTFYVHSLVLCRYPQGTSLRVTPTTNDLNNPSVSPNTDVGLRSVCDFQDDSSSYYDKSDKDSPLHRYDMKNVKDLNIRDYEAGER